MEPESDSERLARRCACLADAREEEAEVCAAMGPSLFPWGSWETPRHDDTRRSHVLGQFPQGRPTPSPYQTTTPSTSHPNSSSALRGTGLRAASSSRRISRSTSAALHFNSSRPARLPPTFKANAPCPNKSWHASSEISASRTTMGTVRLTSRTSFTTRLYVLKKHSLSHLIR